MKLYYLLAVVACLFLNTSIEAQTHMSCGLHDHEMLVERLLLNKKYLKEIGTQQRDGTVSYVPVKYHIIGRTDGSLRQSPKKVLDMHCALNNFYSDGDDGIQFYIKDGFNYINDTETYNDHPSSTGRMVFADNRVDNAINIFIPADADPQPGPIDPNGGTVLGYYNTHPNRDWIVLRKLDATGNSLTIFHEIGHYFSLLHPFNGWEGEPYDAALHGVTVTNWAPDGTPNEKQDGSNCNSSGDYVCDTPPCYLFDSACDYSGGARDPDGTLVNPDENNIMDYFNDNCAPKYLSPDQKALIQADYENRTELHAPWSPIATTITGAPTIVAPADDSTTPGYGDVVFDWDPVNGADRYLLEIDFLADFSFDPTTQVVFQTNATISGIFDADRTYRWRVTPFNPYYACGTSSSVNKFTTGTSIVSTTDVLAVENLLIAPNPISEDYVIVSLDTENAFDAQISIVSATGQTLQVSTRHFQVGHSDVELSINNIPNGIYFLNITSDDKLITKKVVVAK